MRFIGLAGWCDNDGGIIPLKAAVNISPTCGLLETKTATVGGRGHGHEWISSLPYRSFSQCTNMGEGALVPPHKQIHSETV